MFTSSTKLEAAVLGCLQSYAQELEEVPDEKNMEETVKDRNYPLELICTVRELLFLCPEIQFRHGLKWLSVTAAYLFCSLSSFGSFSMCTIVLYRDPSLCGTEAKNSDFSSKLFQMYLLDPGHQLTGIGVVTDRGP